MSISTELRIWGDDSWSEICGVAIAKPDTRVIVAGRDMRSTVAVVERAFAKDCNGAEYRKSDHLIKWPNGSTLYLAWVDLVWNLQGYVVDFVWCVDPWTWQPREQAERLTQTLVSALHRRNLP